ncbi:peptidoglycan recognition protein family protein [Patescibacteria group bacterium]|nr:peptidoglycan recognition protein family protein [Patescibacteria group bacterium]MBU1938916.1 peptidoglycan recognition protein family protein [Patescibacteria group bacterium]
MIENSDHSKAKPVPSQTNSAQITTAAPAVSEKTPIKKEDANPVATPRKWACTISQNKALPNAWDRDPSPSQRKDLSAKCPPEMVNVADEFCVDRYEASIFSDGQRISPFYHPSYYHSKALFNLWKTKFAEFSTPKGLSMPIPEPDLWQLSAPFKVQAVSKGGTVPNGHTNLRIAKEACEAAGKRVCSPAEWKKACRSEEDTKFPYGDKYQWNLCNVFRDTHPIQVLHTEGSSALNDPRLNMVKDGQGNPLLEKTGTRTKCASKWSDDAAYDMVGNLDEWVDDPGGTFAGGFYSRSTREGCDASISGHPASYFDYSTGVRCCRDLVTGVVKDPHEKPKIVCRPKEVVLPGIKVVPRGEWAPLPPNPDILGNMENCDNYPIEKITLHHTGDRVITKPGEGRKMAGGAVYFHLGNAEKKRGKGWGDVAYHYLVTPEGEILEGRNPAFRGDSNTRYYPNDKNHSHTPEHHLLISVVGNYEKKEQEFTAEARLAVYRVLMAGLRYYDLKPGDVIFHKDVAYTGCPGSQVIDWYKTSGRYQIANQMKLLPK